MQKSETLNCHIPCTDDCCLKDEITLEDLISEQKQSTIILDMDEEISSDDDTSEDCSHPEIDLVKELSVELSDGFNRMPLLKEDEFPHIYKDHVITLEEANEALDILATYFMQNNLYKVVCNLSERNICISPEQEVSMDEIEQKFGSRVKIVNK